MVCVERGQELVDRHDGVLDIGVEYQAQRGPGEEIAVGAVAVGRRDESVGHPLIEAGLEGETPEVEEIERAAAGQPSHSGQELVEEGVLEDRVVLQDDDELFVAGLVGVAPAGEVRERTADLPVLQRSGPPGIV